MLNKKMLAASIAVGLTSANAVAAFDLDVSASDPSNAPLVYATEILTQANIDQGAIVVTGGDLNTSFDIAPILGATLPATVFVRIDLGGASFSQNVDSTNFEVAGSGSGTGVVGTTVAGGNASSSFIIVPVTLSSFAADEKLEVTFSFDGSTPELGLIAPVDGTASTITISGYADSTGAQNGSGALTASRAQQVASFASALSGKFTGTADVVTATFASEFKEFDDSKSGVEEKVAPLASINTENLLNANLSARNASSLTLDGQSFANFLPTANYSIQLNGDLTFGTFTLHSNPNGPADCTTAKPVEIPASGTLVVSRDGLFGDTDASTPEQAEHVICVTVDGETVIPRGNYSVSLTVPNAAQGGTGVNAAGVYTNAVNSIVYDTTSYSIPFLSTFGEYNQRVIITNTSGNDAEYFMTFSPEEGTTATPKDKARGIVPAGEMVVLTADSVVELDGRPRTSATLELGLDALNTQVATQTVNRSTSGTDTVFIKSNADK